MIRIVLIIAFASITALMACDNCIDVEVAKAHQEAVYKELTIYEANGLKSSSAYREALKEYQYWSNIIKAKEIKND